MLMSLNLLNNYKVSYKNNVYQMPNGFTIRKKINSARHLPS